MVSVDEAQAKKEEALFRRSDEIIQMCEENIRKMKRKIQGAIDRPQDVIDGEIHDYYQDRIQDEEKRVRDRHRRFNIARRQTLEDSKESVLKYRSNIERLRKKRSRASGSSGRRRGAFAGIFEGWKGKVEGYDE